MARDITEAEFQTEVIERSRERPIVVDFWAPWCGPCRTLGPVLEAQVDALDGRVALVKINSDDAPELSARFSVRSIPAVKGFRNGEVVADFVGARDARFIRSWLEDLSPSPARAALEAALALAESGDDGAESALAPLLETPEVAAEAALALAALRITRGAIDEAAAALDGVDPRSPLHEKAVATRALVTFLGEVDAYGGAEQAEQDLADDEADHAARFAAAAARALGGDDRAALDLLLDLVTRSRTFREDIARRTMLVLFDHLGPTHELTREYRRRLQIVT